MRRAFTAVVMFGVFIGTYHVVHAGFFNLLGVPAERLPETAVPAVGTLTLLEAAKNIDPNPSRGGAELRVVQGAALQTEIIPGSARDTTVRPPSSADQIAIHRVDEGESLSRIAEMFGVSVSTIVWANALKSDTDIRPGDELLILPISGVQHTVQKGDTLASVAKKYGGNKEEIIAYNGLADSGTLAVGSTITIPGGEIVVETPKATIKVAAQTGLKGATGAQSVSGYFIHPLPGSVRTQGLHGYNGVDFGAGAGTPIRAAAGGTVIVSRAGGWNGGYGTYVVIDHANGTQTLYAHNSKNEVWQGQKVSQGDIIGYVGNTGRSTGNHLHFEVRGAKNPF